MSAETPLESVEQRRSAAELEAQIVTGRFSDRHVLVTGGGTGIGRAIAHRLAREGARLSLFGRRAELLETVAAEIEAAGCERPHVAGLDIRERAAVDAAFRSAAEARGAVHALIANAGVGGPNEAGPSDRFDELVSINLTGTYNCARAAEGLLADDSEPRHLVLMASILARIGVPGYTGYCASKTALCGLARALAMELAGRQVQVNAVCPGWVDTAMAREGLEGMAGAMGVSLGEAHGIAMQDVPVGRMSQPEDIAGLVAWLISGDARGVTGQSIDMNGGAFML